MEAKEKLNRKYSLAKHSADGNYEVRYKCNVLIYSHGEVLWVPPAIYQVNITSGSYFCHCLEETLCDTYRVLIVLAMTT